MRVSRDIETELYAALTTDGYSASAHALPATLGQTLPHVHVTRTGGFETDLVIETNLVDFDVYAADPAEAMVEATNLTDWVRKYDAYVSEISTLPYHNPDPRHPSLPRATFKAQILTRVKGGYNA